MPICVTKLCHCAEFNYIIEYIYDIRYMKLVAYIRKNPENKTDISYIGKCSFNQVMVCVTKKLIAFIFIASVF